MKEVWLVDSDCDGVCAAFETVDEARMHVLKAWVQEIPTLYRDITFDGKTLTAVEQIKGDFEGLMTHNCIDDYAYIYPVPFGKQEEEQESKDEC